MKEELQQLVEDAEKIRLRLVSIYNRNTLTTQKVDVYPKWRAVSANFNKLIKQIGELGEPPTNQ